MESYLDKSLMNFWNKVYDGKWSERVIGRFDYDNERVKILCCGCCYDFGRNG